MDRNGDLGLEGRGWGAEDRWEQGLGQPGRGTGCGVKGSYRGQGVRSCTRPQVWPPAEERKIGRQEGREVGKEKGKKGGGSGRGQKNNGGNLRKA